jgi:disulfide oxidoreductase YuzD
MTEVKIAVKIQKMTGNPNLHTARGMGLLERSIKKLGYVTPMTATADGTIIDGNARLETTSNVMAEAEPIIIHHDGTRPIIAVRDDILTQEDPRAKEIAVAANRISQVDLLWNAEELKTMQVDGVEIGAYFAQIELNSLAAKEKSKEAAEQRAEVESTITIKCKVFFFKPEDWINYKNKITNFLNQNEIPFEIEE